MQCEVCGCSVLKVMEPVQRMDTFDLRKVQCTDSDCEHIFYSKTILDGAIVDGDVVPMDVFRARHVAQLRDAYLARKTATLKKQNTKV